MFSSQPQMYSSPSQPNIHSQQMYSSTTNTNSNSNINGQSKSDIQLLWSRLSHESTTLNLEKRKLKEIWVKISRMHERNALERKQFEEHTVHNVTYLDDDTMMLLNVEGTLFETTVKVLRRDKYSILTTLCTQSPPPPLEKDMDGSYFIQRDSLLFRYILQYLRDGTLPRDVRVLEEVYTEAGFYRLGELRRDIEMRFERGGMMDERMRSGSRGRERDMMQGSGSGIRSNWIGNPMDDDYMNTNMNMNSNMNMGMRQSQNMNMNNMNMYEGGYNKQSDSSMYPEVHQNEGGRGRSSSMQNEGVRGRSGSMSPSRYQNEGGRGRSGSMSPSRQRFGSSTSLPRQGRGEVGQSWPQNSSYQNQNQYDYQNQNQNQYENESRGYQNESRLKDPFGFSGGVRR